MQKNKIKKLTKQKAKNKQKDPQRTLKKQEDRVKQRELFGSKNPGLILEL